MEITSNGLVHLVCTMNASCVVYESYCSVFMASELKRLTGGMDFTLNFLLILLHFNVFEYP